MNIESYRDFCLSKPGTSHDFLFDESTLVFRVMNKIFALMDVDTFEFVNLKCDPDLAIELRERYEGVKPGYHMSKKNWNSVYTELIPDNQLMEWTNHSYELVVAGLPKNEKEKLKDLG